MAILEILAALALTQASASPPTDATATADSARAAQAAERAATAAERAAEAAARAADAAEKIAARTMASAAATVPPEGPSAAWTGAATLGLISLTGNSRALTFNSNLNLERKSEDWIFATKANATYGQATLPAAAAASSTIALAAGAQLRGDRRLTERVSAYLLTGADTDHVKSVELRAIGEAGSGITWVDVKEGELQKSRLRTDLAFRYADESRFQYYPTLRNVPDATLIAPRFGVAYRYALNKDVVFMQDAEVMPNVVGASRVLVNSLTKLTARLVASLSLGVSFAVAHDSLPAPGKVPTDTALSVGLELGL